ncbi:LacI family transcriptional regulator [bacterium]|nr:MAG: LacI family transcriptional regulator [bacterium]
MVVRTIKPYGTGFSRRSPMAVTQKDIAQQLGISQQTVASALSGKGQSRMSEKTRSQVLLEAKRMGYRPNLAARALTQQRTGLIAVWTKNLANPFYAHVLEATESLLRTSGYEMIVRVIPGEELSPRLSEEWQSAQWPVDGIISIENALQASQFLKTRAGVTPLVCVGGYDKKIPELDYVWVDLYQATFDAVEHLIDQGCQRIATFMHALGFTTGSPRYDGYTDAMVKNGRRPEYIVVPETTKAAGRAVLQTYAAKHGYPDGLFCYNDDLAIGAFRFLRDSGKSVPNEIALIGCDGIEDTDYLEMPLSTIIQPVDQMCAKAWDLLQRRINDGGVQPQHESLLAHLEVRASSQRN